MKSLLNGIIGGAQLVRLIIFGAMDSVYWKIKGVKEKLKTFHKLQKIPGIENIIGQKVTDRSLYLYIRTDKSKEGNDPLYIYIHSDGTFSFMTHHAYGRYGTHIDKVKPDIVFMRARKETVRGLAFHLDLIRGS